MSTEAQFAANALRSTGPKSADGKARASRNATKHGINSQVLYNERQEDYDANTQAFLAKFEPQYDVEHRLVERMADCEWRLIRARYIETATIDPKSRRTAELIDERFETIEEPARVAYALQLLDRSQAGAYANVQRQEARLHRHYERCYKTFREIQKETHKKISHNEANSALNLSKSRTEGLASGNAGTHRSSLTLEDTSPQGKGW